MGKGAFSYAQTTHARPPVTSASGRLVVYPVWEKAITWLAVLFNPAMPRRVSTETPLKCTPSLDQVVTQWMSPEYADSGRAWISSQVQVVGCATRPSTENDHDARSGFGVTSAFSIGHWF